MFTRHEREAARQTLAATMQKPEVARHEREVTMQTLEVTMQRLAAARQRPEVTMQKLAAARNVSVPARKMLEAAREGPILARNPPLSTFRTTHYSHYFVSEGQRLVGSIRPRQTHHNPLHLTRRGLRRDVDSLHFPGIMVGHVTACSPARCRGELHHCRK